MRQSPATYPQPDLRSSFAYREVILRIKLIQYYKLKILYQFKVLKKYHLPLAFLYLAQNNRKLTPSLPEKGWIILRKIF
jgi:hypothetical protein